LKQRIAAVARQYALKLAAQRGIGRNLRDAQSLYDGAHIEHGAADQEGRSAPPMDIVDGGVGHLLILGDC